MISRITAMTMFITTTKKFKNIASVYKFKKSQRKRILSAILIYYIATSIQTNQLISKQVPYHYLIIHFNIILTHMPCLWGFKQKVCHCFFVVLSDFPLL